MKTPEELKQRVVELSAMERATRIVRDRRMRLAGYERVEVHLWVGTEIVDLDNPGTVIGYYWRKKAPGDE